MPLICLVAVLVVFIHAYQVTQQWKAYDDIYRGRTNSTGTQPTSINVNKYTNTPVYLYMSMILRMFQLHIVLQAYVCNHTISFCISLMHTTETSSPLPGCPQVQDCIHPYFWQKVLTPILLSYSLCIGLLYAPKRSMICS